MRNRIISLLLALALCLTLLPLAAFAAGEHSHKLCSHGDGCTICPADAVEDKTFATALTCKEVNGYNRLHAGDEQIENNQGIVTLKAGTYYLTQSIDVSRVNIEGNVLLCLNGNNIVVSMNQYCVRVENGAALTLCDCKNNSKITHGSYNGRPFIGGGVSVDPGSSFIMYGGSISDNSTYLSHATGNGVLVESGSSFTMYGGSITNNTTAGKGGGVYVGENAAFTMHDGTISGNTASAYSGVYVSETAAVTISGGTITGNTKENLFLNGQGARITIASNLRPDARIGVSSSLTADGQTPIKIAAGAANSNLNYTKIFTADALAQGYVVTQTGAELFLTKHTHNWTYAADEETKTITATCSNNDLCPLSGDGGSVTLKAPEGPLTYTGKDQPAILENNLKPGAGEPAVGYVRIGEFGPEKLENGALPKSADTYTASMMLGSAEVSVEYTIDKAELTVTANAKTISYGDEPANDGVTYHGFAEGEGESNLGGELTYTYSYTPDLDIGSYIITPGGLSAANYKITYGTGTLTVEQREVTLIWHDHENRTYDDGKTVTAEAGNLVNGDKISVAVGQGHWTAVGTYEAIADELRGKKKDNYKLPYDNSVWYTINEADQTLTFANPGDQSVVYGDTLDNPAANDRTGKDGSGVTYTSSDETIATVDANGTVTAKKTGTVTITASADAVTNKYNVGTARYQLTVVARPVTVTVDAVSRVYGEGNPSFTATVPDGTLVGNDTIEALGLTLNTTANEASDAGSYAVTGEASNPNYAVTVDGADKLTIIARPITVTVDPAERVYGEADPDFTAQLTGGTLVNGDTVASLNLTLTSTATETSPVGSYNVTGTASNKNYDVTVVGEKKLTVTPKSITVTVDAVSRAYGEANPPFTAAAPDGALVGSDTIDSLGLSLSSTADATSPVGSYDVTGTASSPNYTVTIDGKNKLTVTAKRIPVPAAGTSTFVYNGEVQTYQLAENAYYTITGNTAKDVGKYAAKVTLTDTANTVWSFGTTGAQYYPFEITPAPATVTVLDQQITVGQSAPELTSEAYTITGLFGDDEISITLYYADSSDTSKPVTPDTSRTGTYAIVAVLGDPVNANYTVTFENGTLTIVNHPILPILPALMPATGNGTFTDVAANAYYYEAVEWAVKNGITDGLSAKRFGPDAPCTRAQIVTFLWRAAGSPEPMTRSSFTDVVSGSYYEKAVAWAIENGITVGTSATTFSPDMICTRAHAVTFLARAVRAIASGSAGFRDVSDSAYYAKAVKWATDNAITNGIAPGLFGPNYDCTRAQIVTFLWRLYAAR